MKKTFKLFVFVSMLLIIFSGSIFAAENEYILKKEIIYQNERKSTLKDGFIEIMLGQLDFTA